MDNKKRIWVLTEEKPKAHIITTLLGKLDGNLYHIINNDELKIIPIFNGSLFSHTYLLDGLLVNGEPVYIKVVSGNSSFVDYLIYESYLQPLESDIPLLVAEVTKTDDSESRNTGINQRATKFIYATKFYPNVPKYMMFDIQVLSKENKSPTYSFGSRCFKTLGIDIIPQDIDAFKKFDTIQELIDEKAKMKPPPKGNVPTSVTFDRPNNTIYIGARLVKNGSLGHDPNIGFVSLVAGAIRKLGFDGKIIIINHGLPSDFILRSSNKFAYIADILNLTLDGVQSETVSYKTGYWRYELAQEKHATILASIIAENIGCEIIYENHGGTERGYLYVNNKPVTVEKYTDRDDYKTGNKDAKLALPDLVFKKGNHIFIVEGKKYSTLKKGLEEIPALKDFEAKLKTLFQPDITYSTCLILGGEGIFKTIENVEEVFLHLEEGGVINYGEASKVDDTDKDFKLFCKNI